MDSLGGAATGGLPREHLAITRQRLLVPRLGRAVAGGAGPAGARGRVSRSCVPQPPLWPGSADGGLHPAAIYVGAFLLWRLAENGQTTLYWGALGLCVLALFSKQYAITFVPAIVAFDVYVRRWRPLPRWSCIAPDLPFAAATALYLGLRAALFGNMVREQSVSEWTLFSLWLSPDGPLRRPDARLVVGQCGSVLVHFPSGSHAGKLDWLGSSSPWWRSLRWPS